MKKNTGWGEEFVLGEYQKEVILPNLLRLLDLKRGEAVLDLACGPGFFANEFWKKGARVTAVDLSGDLIRRARETYSSEINWQKAPAENLGFLKNQSIDKLVIILAVQNMENLSAALKECHRVLKPKGKLFVVMNHPVFRIPDFSGWQWDEGKKIQYRRLDQYLSESKTKIQMHPGDRPQEYTISFHRPMQFYFKILEKNFLAVIRLEEWISPKKSQPGPRAAAEDRARKEFPLFLMLEAQRLN